MYRSLLLPLDGSVSAEQALPLALGIARRAGTKLDLVSVQVRFPPVYGAGRLLRGASTPVLVQRPLDQSIPQGVPP